MLLDFDKFLLCRENHVGLYIPYWNNLVAVTTIATVTVYRRWFCCAYSNTSCTESYPSRDCFEGLPSILEVVAPNFHGTNMFSGWPSWWNTFTSQAVLEARYFICKNWKHSWLGKNCCSTCLLENWEPPLFSLSEGSINWCSWQRVNDTTVWLISKCCLSGG